MSTSYLSWEERRLQSYTLSDLDDLYAQGFVATRRDRGIFQKTRSIRINTADFNLSSENRRVLKKTEGLDLESHALPYAAYHWTIGKMAKDFYSEKFGDGTFSANKAKELLTDPEHSSFNVLILYSWPGRAEPIGYCIALETSQFLHYCYPFYALANSQPFVSDYPANLGLGMMLRAIMAAKHSGKKYLYLGSAQRRSDTYKLQFSGLEWFDGTNWRKNSNELKKLLLELPS